MHCWHLRIDLPIRPCIHLSKQATCIHLASKLAIQLITVSKFTNPASIHSSICMTTYVSAEIRIQLIKSQVRSPYTVCLSVLECPRKCDRRFPVDSTHHHFQHHHIFPRHPRSKGMKTKSRRYPKLEIPILRVYLEHDRSRWCQLMYPLLYFHIFSLLWPIPNKLLWTNVTFLRSFTGCIQFVYYLLSIMEPESHGLSL